MEADSTHCRSTELLNQVLMQSIKSCTCNKKYNTYSFKASLNMDMTYILVHCIKVLKIRKYMHSVGLEGHLYPHLGLSITNKSNPCIQIIQKDKARHTLSKNRFEESKLNTGYKRSVEIGCWSLSFSGSHIKYTNSTISFIPGHSCKLFNPNKFYKGYIINLWIQKSKFIQVNSYILNWLNFLERYWQSLAGGRCSSLVAPEAAWGSDLNNIY